MTDAFNHNEVNHKGNISLFRFCVYNMHMFRMFCHLGSIAVVLMLLLWLSSFLVSHVQERTDYCENVQVVKCLLHGTKVHKDIHTKKKRYGFLTASSRFQCATDEKSRRKKNECN